MGYQPKGEFQEVQVKTDPNSYTAVPVRYIMLHARPERHLDALRDVIDVLAVHEINLNLFLTCVDMIVNVLPVDSQAEAEKPPPYTRVVSAMKT